MGHQRRPPGRRTYEDLHQVSAVSRSINCLALPREVSCNRAHICFGNGPTLRFLRKCRGVASVLPLFPIEFGKFPQLLIPKPFSTDKDRASDILTDQSCISNPLPTFVDLHTARQLPSSQKILERFPESSHWHLPLVLGYHTGFRTGELFALTWNDVYFKKRLLLIKNLTKKNCRNFF